MSVLDGFDACASSVPARLQYFVNGKFRNILFGFRGSSGSYSLGKVTDPGKLPGIVKPTTLSSGDKCLKDISPVVIL